MLMLILVLQIVGGWFALRMWRFFRVLVDVHASVVCDAKVFGYLVFSTLLAIAQDNDKGEAESDDPETIVHQIQHMTRDMCVNTDIDPRRYVLSDMARLAFRMLRSRSRYHAPNPGGKVL